MSGMKVKEEQGESVGTIVIWDAEESQVPAKVPMDEAFGKLFRLMEARGISPRIEMVFVIGVPRKINFMRLGETMKKKKATDKDQFDPLVNSAWEVPYDNVAEAYGISLRESGINALVMEEGASFRMVKGLLDLVDPRYEVILLSGREELALSLESYRKRGGIRSLLVYPQLGASYNLRTAADQTANATATFRPDVGREKLLDVKNTAGDATLFLAGGSTKDFVNSYLQQVSSILRNPRLPLAPMRDIGDGKLAPIKSKPKPKAPKEPKKDPRNETRKEPKTPKEPKKDPKKKKEKAAPVRLNLGMKDQGSVAELFAWDIEGAISAFLDVGRVPTRGDINGSIGVYWRELGPAYVMEYVENVFGDLKGLELSLESEPKPKKKEMNEFLAKLSGALFAVAPGTFSMAFRMLTWFRADRRDLRKWMVLVYHGVLSGAIRAEANCLKVVSREGSYRAGEEFTMAYGRTAAPFAYPLPLIKVSEFLGIPEGIGMPVAQTIKFERDENPYGSVLTIPDKGSIYAFGRCRSVSGVGTSRTNSSQDAFRAMNYVIQVNEIYEAMTNAE